MLLRGEAVVALSAEAMVLDVVAGVRAVRHFRQREIGDLRERVIEFFGELLFLRLERRDLGLQARDLGHERLCRRFLVASLRGADFARRRVAAGECGLRLLDGGASALVDFDQPLCFARQTAPRQPPVERVGIVTNPLDIVHVFRRHAPRRRGIPVNADADGLGNVVPDSKARGYWTAHAAITPPPGRRKSIIPPAWRPRWARPVPCLLRPSSRPPAPTTSTHHKAPPAQSRPRAV